MKMRFFRKIMTRMTFQKYGYHGMENLYKSYSVDPMVIIVITYSFAFAKTEGVIVL
jgi:hypothetical protein